MKKYSSNPDIINWSKKFNPNSRFSNHDTEFFCQELSVEKQNFFLKKSLEIIFIPFKLFISQPWHHNFYWQEKNLSDEKHFVFVIASQHN